MPGKTRDMRGWLRVLMDVVITAHLPDELAAQLSAAATARAAVGLVEQSTAERVPERLGGQDATALLEAFLGSGSSGRHDALDVPEVRCGLAAQTTLCGI